MDNNDVLRRIRYIFNLSDSAVIALFAEGGLTVTRVQISDWLKKEDDPAFVACSDSECAQFLNGFIIAKRGRREGPQPEIETRLTNNGIFLKLKIALALKAEDILSILSRVDFMLSKHELSAFFRKPTQPQYRNCKDQILRNFLHGLQETYRPVKE